MDVSDYYMFIGFFLAYGWMFIAPQFLPANIAQPASMFGMVIFFVWIFGMELYMFQKLAKHDHIRLMIRVDDETTKILHVFFKNWSTTYCGNGVYKTTFHLAYPKKFPKQTIESLHVSIMHTRHPTKRFQFGGGSAEYHGYVISNHPHSEKCCVVDEVKKAPLRIVEGRPVPNYALCTASGDHVLYGKLFESEETLHLADKIFRKEAILGAIGFYKASAQEAIKDVTRLENTNAELHSINQGFAEADININKMIDDRIVSIANQQDGISNAAKQRRTPRSADMYKWPIIGAIIIFVFVYLIMFQGNAGASTKQLGVWLKNPNNMIVAIIIVAGLLFIGYIVVRRRITEKLGVK